MEGAQEQLLEQVRAMQATMDEITTEGVRSQKSYWEAMYKKVSDEMRSLRAERRNENDDDVCAELTELIKGLEPQYKKWGKLSGHIV